MLLLLAGCPKAPTQTAGTTPAAQSPAGAAKAWSGNAADFTFTSFAGKALKLSSFAGKPVVLNFWADW